MSVEPSGISPPSEPQGFQPSEAPKESHPSRKTGRYVKKVEQSQKIPRPETTQEEPSLKWEKSAAGEALRAQSKERHKPAMKKVQRLRQKKEEPIKSEEEAAQAFWGGREDAVVEFVKRGREGRVFQRPVFGPIQRSVYTIQAQEMFEDLSSNFHEAVVTFENGSLIIRIKNKEHNISQLLPLVEFDHISLPKEALDVYRILLSSHEFFFKPKLHEPLSLDKSSDADFENYFKRQGYEEPGDPEVRLSLSEKLALNIFTGDAYKLINPLMRNQIDKVFQSLALNPLDSMVKEALLHFVVAASGLKKLPPYFPPEKGTNYLWRVEYDDLDFPLEARRRAVAEGGGVGYHLGFLSSSHTKPSSFGAQGEEIVSGVLIKGSNGKNISFFSQHPMEGEILSAPSFIQWTDVKNIKQRGREIPIFIGHLISSPQEYAVLYDIYRMLDYFLTLDPSAFKQEFALLPVKIRATFCAFLIQNQEKALQPIVDEFFLSTDMHDAFISVDSKTQENLLTYAQDHKIPTSTQLVRLHAQCLATSIQASQMIQDKMLSTSSYATITGLMEHCQRLAHTNPELLKTYYQRPGVQQKIRDLKKECTSRFTPESLVFSGQDSLNRELLTGTKWNDALRDKDVILALFALEADPEAALLDSQLNCLSYAPGRTITSMLAEGVKTQHPVVLETLPLNGGIRATPDLAHLRAYIGSKAIDQTFLPIFNALKEAYTMAVGSEPPSTSQQSLFDIPYTPSGWQAYLNIFTTLEKAVLSEDESSLYSSEARTHPQQLKAEVGGGFHEFCFFANIDLNNTTLPELVEQMACSDILLDQRVSHLMYDRLHLLVALRSPDLTISLKGGEVSLGEVFRKLAEFFASQPKIPNRYALAAEQLYCRLIFLAEKLSSSFPSLISHEDLMRCKQEAGSVAMARANAIQQLRAEALREELRALVSHPVIRNIVAEDFGIDMPDIQVIERADYVTLQVVKGRIKTHLKKCDQMIGCFERRLIGHVSIEDLVNRPQLALNFMKFVHACFLNNLRAVIGMPVRNSSTMNTREEYEQNAKEVEEFLRDPDRVHSLHELHLFPRLHTADSFVDFIFNFLKKNPSITQIHLDLYPEYCSEALRDFKFHGLADKVVSLTIHDISEFDWRPPEEVWTLTNLQELSFSQCLRMREIKDAISCLEKLQKLSISGTQTAVLIPEAVWRLKNLVELTLDCFVHTSIPDEIASRETLQKLLLRNFTFSSIPEAIWHLKNLTELRLEFSDVSSYSQEKVSSLSKLTVVEIKTK